MNICKQLLPCCIAMDIPYVFFHTRYQTGTLFWDVEEAELYLVCCGSFFGPVLMLLIRKDHFPLQVVPLVSYTPKHEMNSIYPDLCVSAIRFCIYGSSVF